MLRVAWPASLACATVLAGCSPPLQYGGLIPVDEAGFRDRLQQLCRRGLTTHAGETCTPERAVSSPREPAH
jgi:hypothetical protein